MSQDNKKSFVMYQGGGDNHFPVPMTKGKYGTISVAFVRRGLDQYEYNPDTWGLNGGLFAWDLSGTKVYTDTAIPAIGATIYDQYGVDTGDTVSAVSGDTITVNTDVYTRDSTHDVKEDSLLTWTGATLELGDYIVIQRTTTRTQPFEFPNNQKHIEKSDDNLERQIQEVADKVDNALLVDPTHTIDSNKMNPVEWMKTILRSVDKSVRGFRCLNGWLDYSLDDPNIADVDKTWTHLVNTDNIKAIREQSRIENNETIYYTEYLAQDGSWKILSDPHKWDNMKLSDLADTDFTNLSAGNFIMFDGLKWKNVYSSATASWGALIGDMTAQTDLMNKFTEYVRTDGTSIMTAPLKFRAGSMRGAVGPYLNGISFWKLDSQGNITNIANLTDSQFLPVTTNAIDLGRSANKWKDLYLAGKAYMSVINNGYDIAVPVTNSADTLALKSEVDLAANSGDQLTEKGVWYAKMYSATVAPSAEDGTNYADFSQTDGQGNPIIVIYKRQNGAWVQDQTITPPAEYNGYVPVTSKIWDIVEQSGQQGGKVLWSHNQKTFTPSPLIISFEDIEITGDSTVVMPATPTDNSIPTKKYVDDAVAGSGGGYHPGLFAHEWDDHLRNDVQWLRGDTFSWQDGSVYEAAYNHLVDDVGDNNILYAWATLGSTFYTKSSTPSVGDAIYNANGTTAANTVESVGDGYIVTLGTQWARTPSDDTFSESETIGGIIIKYMTAADGHKICLATEESNVAAIYNATGAAWYYIIDTANQRFKLPRKHSTQIVRSYKSGTQWYRLYADGWVEQGGFIASTATDYQERTIVLSISMADTNYSAFVTMRSNYFSTAAVKGYACYDLTTASFKTFTQSSNITQGNYWHVSGQSNIDMSQFLADEKYLYFYVGNFTQSALENTAGLNAELFNGKVDLDAANLSNAGKETVAHLAMPNNTYNDITVGVNGAQYTAPADGYFSVHAGSTANGGYVELVSDTKVEFGTSSSAQNGVVLRACITVSKGDIIRLWYSSVNFFHYRFYYANGAV